MIKIGSALQLLKKTIIRSRMGLKICNMLMIILCKSSVKHALTKKAVVSIFGKFCTCMLQR